MNDKNITKIHNILTTCLDCAGVPQEATHSPIVKLSEQGLSYYVDLCIEDYKDEDLAYFIGFIAERIGMKNVWFDTYPKSKRVHIELCFPLELLAR